MTAYQSNAVHGGVAAADQYGLVLMLMNAAVERMTTARGCIERREMVRKTKLLHSCVRIIAELRGSLNMAEGGAVAQNLSGLYDYMMRRLLRANLENDLTCLTEVLSLLGELRAVWVSIGPQARTPALQAVPVPRTEPTCGRAAAAPDLAPTPRSAAHCGIGASNRCIRPHRLGARNFARNGMNAPGAAW